MAAKISTIVMKVDLDCKSCYKKIRKAIINLQEKEKIETVVYDEKNNTVTVSGPFDPERMSKKLCCRACKVIKDIQIKEEPKPEKKKPNPPTPKPDKIVLVPVVKAPVCSCGCKPWYGSYYGINRCPWCGRVFDCEVMAPPQVVVQPPVFVYGAPQGFCGQKSCGFFYEEESQAACSVM